MSRILFVLALLTIMLIGAYPFLPEKKWVWIPGKPVIGHLYADNYFGGNSTSQWENEGNYHFSCLIKDSTDFSPPFCGGHFHMSEEIAGYIDLSGYSRMLVDADYKGENQKLRFHLNEFVPEFSDPIDPVATRTAKYMSTFVKTEELDQPFVINMDEFIVAEWWVNDTNIPRRYSAASLEHILTFGVDIITPIALGRHEFKLNRVTFIGEWVTEKQWYLSILLVWIGSLFIAGTGRIILLLRDTSRLRTEKRKYEKLSVIDSLTGLLNRYGIEQVFEKKIKGQEPVGLLLLDIDHFKPVNDTFGHNIGDLVLQRIATEIERQLRKNDKASRWGGEEFLILLPETSHRQACDIAERIRESVFLLEHAELNNQKVTISIGVCELTEGSDFDSAFAEADLALYKAKEKGRNRVENMPIKKSD